MYTSEIAIVHHEVDKETGTSTFTFVAGPELIICDSEQSAKLQAALKWPEECQAKGNLIATTPSGTWCLQSV